MRRRTSLPPLTVRHTNHPKRIRPRPSPAAPGPGHSWVEVRPTARGVRSWPSDQPRQPACSGIGRKYKSTAVPTARSSLAPGLMCPPQASVKVEAPPNQGKEQSDENASIPHRTRKFAIPQRAGRSAHAPAADFDLELIDSRTLDGNIQELVYRPTLHA